MTIFNRPVRIMKTIGIIHAHTKHFVFFVALAAAAPVFAQGDPLSRENFSFAGPGKNLSSTDPYKQGLTATTPQLATAVRTTLDLSEHHYGETSTNDPGSSTKSEYKHLDIDRIRTKPFGKNLEISFKSTSFAYPEGSREEIGVKEYATENLLLYAIVMKQYAKENDLDTTYAFISNMGMLSTKKRFFVINLVTMEVECSGLVSQGRGLGRTKYDKQYSNSIESKCTSLGRYKISNKYKGSYGESYKLVGLDSSNQNAVKRNIVLHQMGCIPDDENIAPTCVSEGCPAVSPNFLSGLANIIDTRKNPVLLWVFDSNLEEIIAKEFPSKYHTCTIHHHESENIDVP